MSTAPQRYASLMIGRPVAEFIAEHRANGEHYPAIALAIRDQTDGVVDVTPEAVRLWHKAAEAAGLVPSLADDAA